jgi:hypothetical protein
MERLEAEEPLNLVPDDDREIGAQDDQRRQDDPEAHARQAPLAHVILTRTATGSMEPVRPVDRGGIDWWRLLDGILTPGRLSHAGTI